MNSIIKIAEEDNICLYHLPSNDTLIKLFKNCLEPLSPFIDPTRKSVTPTLTKIRKSSIEKLGFKDPYFNFHWEPESEEEVEEMQSFEYVVESMESEDDVYFLYKKNSLMCQFTKNIFIDNTRNTFSDKCFDAARHGPLEDRIQQVFLDCDLYEFLIKHAPSILEFDFEFASEQCWSVSEDRDRRRSAFSVSSCIHPFFINQNSYLEASEKAQDKITSKNAVLLLENEGFKNLPSKYFDGLVSKISESDFNSFITKNCSSLKEFKDFLEFMPFERLEHEWLVRYVLSKAASRGDLELIKYALSHKISNKLLESDKNKSIENMHCTHISWIIVDAANNGQKDIVNYFVKDLNINSREVLKQILSSVVLNKNYDMVKFVLDLIPLDPRFSYVFDFKFVFNPYTESEKEIYKMLQAKKHIIHEEYIRIENEKYKLLQKAG